jgi:hypothetical protein
MLVVFEDPTMWTQIEKIPPMIRMVLMELTWYSRVTAEVSSSAETRRQLDPGEPPNFLPCEAEE